VISFSFGVGIWISVRVTVKPLVATVRILFTVWSLSILCLLCDVAPDNG
jgi:hypothetical protein